MIEDELSLLELHIELERLGRIGEARDWALGITGFTIAVEPGAHKVTISCIIFSDHAPGMGERPKQSRKLRVVSGRIEEAHEQKLDAPHFASCAKRGTNYNGS